MKEDIYRIVDSFLTEAKDQNGNERSLERLNSDRHLAVDEFGKLIQKAKERGRQEMKEEIIKWAEKEKYDNIIHQLDDSEEDDEKRDWCIDYDDLIKKLKEK